MVKVKSSTASATKKENSKVIRKGVHAKTKSSNSKNSNHYRKLSRGQG
jgi:hypothetical protein